MKKKIISIAAAAAVAASAIPVSAASADEKLFVCGDSITTGYGLPGYASGDNYSAADSFGNRLGSEYGEYVNLAVDGRTSAELYEAMKTDEEMRSGAQDADVIVISIGGNDFIMTMVEAAQNALASVPGLLTEMLEGKVDYQQAFKDNMELITDSMIEAVKNVDTDATRENIGGIFDEIEAMNPDCQVYILTVYDPYENIPMMEAYEETSQIMLPQLNDAIRAAAEGASIDVTVVDVESSFRGHAAEYTNIQTMDIHPNVTGHDVIYGMLSAAISENKAASGESASESEAAVTEAVPAETDVTEPASEPAASELVSEPASEPVTKPAQNDTVISAPLTDSSSIPDTGNASSAAYAATALLALTAAAGTYHLRRK